jgi:hypothetical protein
MEKRFSRQANCSLLFKKSSTSCGSRIFITIFTAAYHFISSADQSSPLHRSRFLKMNFKFILPSTHSPSRWSLLQVFYLNHVWISILPNKCLMLLVLLVLIMLVDNACEEYKSWSSSWHSFLQSLLNSFPSDPNIFLRTLLSNTLSLCSSFNLRDQFSLPY